MIAKDHMKLYFSPNIISNRAEIEARIMEIEAQLNSRSSFADDILKDYLQAWADLVDYYHDHAEPDCVYIRCDVLSAFLRTKMMLRETLENRQYTSVHQQAQNGLTILEARMNSILAVGESILKQPA